MSAHASAPDSDPAGSPSLPAVVADAPAGNWVDRYAPAFAQPYLRLARLGLIRTGFLFGLLNVAVAIALLLALRKERRMRIELVAALLSAASLLAGIAWSERIQRFSEVAFYNEPVIYAKSTPFQRIVLTRRGGDLRLYLNGNLQFSSRDEYRYHEALVWPVLGRVAEPRNVLILGGGDGRADTGIVDEDVHPAELLDRMVDHALRLCGIGDVGLDRDGPPSGLPDQLGGLLETVDAACSEHDVGPCFGQRQRNRLADATRTAGDERDAPLKRNLHGFFLCCYFRQRCL